MFSEYASRFLAQSQSKLGFDEPAESTTTQHRRSQRHPAAGTGRMDSRSYLNRGGGNANPYTANGTQSRFSQFPFGRGQQTKEAPLFYSATDDFREEDDEQEREREVADYYALQRSRRYFSGDKLESSGEGDDDGLEAVEGKRAENALSHHYSSPRGIRSSWRGDARKKRGRPRTTVEESVAESPESEAESIKGKGKLVDVELESSRRSSLDSIRPVEAIPEDDFPPSIQKFKKSPGIQRNQPWTDDTDETARLNPPLEEDEGQDRESVPDIIQPDPLASPRHDESWSLFFWLMLAALFATSLLVYLHTDAPSRKKPLGDSIYNVLRASYHLLATYTLISVIVSAIWLMLLRTAIRPLTVLLGVGVPIVLFSFSIFAIVNAFKGQWHGKRFQDKLMAFTALLPLVGMVLWCYLVVKARHNIDRAIQILQLATKVLAASPALVLSGFVAQAATIIWFWTWLLLFSRVFLEGHFTSGAKSLWVLDSSTWWLGAWFILQLLWTLGVISGVQRATTAAATSQWYFHRHTLPAPSSRAVVLASFNHAITTSFGTIALQSLCSLAIRVPLLILPRRLVGLLSMVVWSIVPSPLAALTNPLTLSYAAVHSQPLSVSARQLSNLSFISRTETTTTLAPTSASAPPQDALVQWRTAKLILHSTRYLFCTTFLLAGWASTKNSPNGTGSLYAYIVGLGAGVVGWSVLGSMEGVVVGVVDALVVCWASEASSESRRVYCRKARDVFGGRLVDGGTV